jgi:hypothetical protein
MPKKSLAETNPELAKQWHPTLNGGFILLSSEPFPFSKTHLKALEKATQKQVLLVDGAYFSWYGSRLQNAFRYFKTLH